MVHSRKRADCQLRIGEELFPQLEEFKYLGLLFTSEGRMEGGIGSDVDSKVVYCSEERAEQEG